MTPRIQQHAVALPPGLIILAIAAFGVLLGLPGVMLATPLTVVSMVLVNRLYVEGILGKKDKMTTRPMRQRGRGRGKRGNRGPGHHAPARGAIVSAGELAEAPYTLPS